MNIIYFISDENTKITYMRDKNVYSPDGGNVDLLNKVREKKHSPRNKARRFDNFRFLQETVHVCIGRLIIIIYIYNVYIYIYIYIYICVCIYKFEH